MTNAWREHPAVEASSRTWADVVQLVHRQHGELANELARIPGLGGSAQLDVCLHVRRLMAVHEALERAVLTPLAGATHDLERVLRAAEQAEAGGVETEIAIAWKRVGVAFVHHVDVIGRAGVDDLHGDLDDRVRAEVAEVLRLWEGRADAYLGNEYDVMLDVALYRIAEASAAHDQEKHP